VAAEKGFEADLLRWKLRTPSTTDDDNDDNDGGDGDDDDYCCD
jgi:hypothetical protein